MLITQPLTVKDYLALPEDHPRCELIHGEIYMLPAPNEFHQNAVIRLGFSFLGYLELHEIGTAFPAPFDLFLEDFTSVQPDLLYVAHDNASARVDGGVWGVPDLVVEILSPSNSTYDLTTKRDLYREHKIREIWFIDPVTKSITVDRLVADRYERPLTFREDEVLTTPLLPGYELVVAKLFMKTWKR